MPSDDPESQSERRRVLRNDARVRDALRADQSRDQSRNGDTSTYLDHTHSELGGRFSITEHQTITGVVSSAPPPLPSNSPWAGADPVGPEPSLGYRIDALNPYDPEPSSAPASAARATGDLTPATVAPSAPPLADVEQRSVRSPSFSNQQCDNDLPRAPMAKAKPEGVGVTAKRDQEPMGSTSKRRRS